MNIELNFSIDLFTLLSIAAVILVLLSAAVSVYLFMRTDGDVPGFGGCIALIASGVFSALPLLAPISGIFLAVYFLVAGLFYVLFLVMTAWSAARYYRYN